MKKLSIYLSLIMVTLYGCDDQIFPELATNDPILVVDAWINDLQQDQVIKLSRTQPYFDQSVNNGVTGAEVYIMDENNNRFDFTDNGNGDYVFSPGAGGFGTVDTDYALFVNIGTESFYATSRKNPVPLVDSVTFRFEEESLGNPDSYWGEFWSRDLLGPGDTYWIKSYKNEEYLSKPSEINAAYDAGFSAGGNVDNLIFIPPIRDAVNPFDLDENDELISPFADGDSLYVEVYSITEEAYNFLWLMREQTDRPGGFAELFATPLSNVNGNILNADENSDVFALGFFCVSSVEGNGARLDISQVPKEPN